jgi:hypothetical protein
MDPRFPHLHKLANSQGGWELPAALAGAGLAGAAYGMGGDAHYDLLRKTLAEDAAPLQPWETTLSRYTKSMSPGASTSLLGVPVGEIITKMRANSDVMGAMGMSKDVLINNPSQKQEGLAHYEQFSRGPLAAYWHQLLKLGGNVPVSPELSGGKEMNYKELMLPQLESFWKKRMYEGGAGAVDKGALKWLLPYEIDTDYLGHQEQLDIIREFAESLPPELQRERHRVETDIMGEPLRKHQQNYMPTYNKVTSTREILKTLGLTAGGAGLGGLAGNYLYRGVTDDEQEDDDSRRMAALMGAGVGGGAGFLASHHGRGLLNKLFTKGAQDITMPTSAFSIMNSDQLPFLKAALEKQAGPLMLGTQALAAGAKGAPSAGRALAKVGPTQVFPRAIPRPAPAGGKIVGLSPLGKGALGAGAVAGAYGLSQFGGEGAVAPAAKPAAPAAKPAAPAALGGVAGVAAAPKAAPSTVDQWLARGGGGGIASPPATQASPSKLDTVLGLPSPGNLQQVMPDRPGTHQRALEAGPKPSGPPILPEGVLGADTLAGQGMTMTGPGSGFAAGVPQIDQPVPLAGGFESGPAKMPPLPTPPPTAPEPDWNSEFQKYHGTSYNPVSSMDQGKLQQMRELFQQHGSLSPSLVYGRQYGKQATARLKVTHPRLGALLAKAARADSDAYISPGRAGLAGAIAPALAGTYAGTKVEDTPHGIAHGLGTGAGMLAGGIGGGALAALLTNPGKLTLWKALTDSQGHLDKQHFQQSATAGGAGLGAMAGGGLASALMANHSNKQRGAEKPKKDPIGGKKEKSKDDSEKDEPKEKEASLTSPRHMAHYALLAADLNTFEKTAGEGVGALLGALLGGTGGALFGQTGAGRGVARDIGGAVGKASTPVANAMTLRPDFLSNPGGHLMDMAEDSTRKPYMEMMGRAFGEDKNFSTAGLGALGAGGGAMVGGALGGLMGKKKPKEEDETDEEEESLSRPAKMAHYAILAAELNMVEKQAAAAAANGYSGHSLQSYLPVGQKRQLSPEEEARIESRKGAVLPKIFKSLKDNPEADIHSPWTMASILGLLGAGGGGVLGAGLGNAIGGKTDNPELGAGIGGALGAGLGGLAGGALGYHGTNAENESIEEMMSRLPEGAKRRDMQSDPVYQAEQERKNRMMAAQLMAMR